MFGIFRVLNQLSIVLELKELEEYYFEKKRDGMDFSEIRRELRDRNIGEDDIKQIIREIDDKILSQAEELSSKSKLNSQFFIGVFLFTIGLFLTIGKYFGLVNLGNYFIIAYGPIFAGLGMMINSKANRTNFFDRKDRIRK